MKRYTKSTTEERYFPKLSRGEFEYSVKGQAQSLGKNNATSKSATIPVISEESGAPVPEE